MKKILKGELDASINWDDIPKSINAYLVDQYLSKEEFNKRVIEKLNMTKHVKNGW